MALTKVRGSGIDADGQEIILDADGDTSISVGTDDKIVIDTAGSERMQINASGDIGMGTSSPDGGLHVKGISDHAKFILEAGGTAGNNNTIFMQFHVDNGTEIASIQVEEGATNEGQIIFKTGGTTEAMRIDKDSRLLIGATTYDANNAGIYLNGASGKGFFTVSGDAPLAIHRLSSDGDLVELRQGNNTEGTISVSGSTVSYNGFSGQHESSGIATNTPIGTVVSTIDELDTYPTGTTKKWQARADHAKVEVSDNVGDSAVYGVVSRFDEHDKVFVASVGIGSVRVTGACAKGDLLESNGDGTAKVQSDDIVRSKTIGKVTIGNSNTGVKLVSCVLYCG